MAEYTREYQQSAGTAPASAQAQRSPITLPRVVAGMRCFHYAAVDEPIIDFQGPRGAAYAEKAICGYADALQRCAPFTTLLILTPVRAVGASTDHMFVLLSEVAAHTREPVD